MKCFSGVSSDHRSGRQKEDTSRLEKSGGAPDYTEQMRFDRLELEKKIIWIQLQSVSQF